MENERRDKCTGKRAKDGLFLLLLSPSQTLESGVIWPKFTQRLHDVDRSPQMNFLKSEVRYCNQFPNGSAMNKGE